MTPNNDRFVQSDKIRDVVFPFFLASNDSEEIKAESFEGTGFLIGQRGRALTAGHVAKRLQNGAAVGGFVGPSDAWFGFGVAAIELHPTEDIAVVALDQPPWHTWNSWMQPCARWEGSSRHYGLWGYPEDLYHEVVVDGIAKGRPDLIFSEGHLRRCMSAIPLPAIKGDSFYELSAMAGRGCSGSPVIAWPPTPGGIWDIIGVYCGERANQSEAIAVGYATRIDALEDWAPEILGHKLIEERARTP